LFGIEEAVFFLLTLIFATLAVVFVVFRTLRFWQTGQPQDWWKVGWLGVLVLVGLSWAAAHDILKGEPNPYAEYAVLMLSGLIFILLGFKVVSQRSRSR
jgi:hypothetical protein